MPPQQSGPKSMPTATNGCVRQEFHGSAPSSYLKRLNPSGLPVAFLNCMSKFARNFFEEILWYLRGRHESACTAGSPRESQDFCRKKLEPRSTTWDGAFLFNGKVTADSTLSCSRSAPRHTVACVCVCVCVCVCARVCLWWRCVLAEEATRGPQGLVPTFSAPTAPEIWVPNPKATDDLGCSPVCSPTPTPRLHHALQAPPAHRWAAYDRPARGQDEARVLQSHAWEISLVRDKADDGVSSGDTHRLLHVACQVALHGRA